MRMRSIQLQRNQFIETKDVQSTPTTRSISKIQPGAVDFSPQCNGLILGAVDGSAQLWWRHSCLQKPLSLEQSATKATLWRCLNRTVGSCCKKVQVSLRLSVLCQPRQLARVRRVKWGTSQQSTKVPKCQQIGVSVCKSNGVLQELVVSTGDTTSTGKLKHPHATKLPQLEQRCWLS